MPSRNDEDDRWNHSRNFVGRAFNWLTFNYRYKTVDTHFGTSFYTLDTSDEAPLIKNKKVVLKNDYIHHVIDVYHI